MDDVYEVTAQTDVSWIPILTAVDTSTPLLPGGDVGLVLPCSATYFRVCRLLISGLGQRLGLSWDAVEDLKLAVSEGCTLVAGVAPESATDRLEMRVRIMEGSIEIDLIGPKEPPSPDPDDPDDGRAMGLFFIESLMDQVQYQSTRLHMVKHLGA